MGEDGRRTRVGLNRYDWEATQEALRVIDTQDLAELARRDISGSALAVAPDGRVLLVHTFRITADSANNRVTADDHRMRVLRADRLNDVASLEVENSFYLRGFSPDGRYAYVEKPAATPHEPMSLRVIDLANGQVVGERRVPGSIAGLLLNPSGGPDI